MNDEDKSKEQLIQELTELRAQNTGVNCEVTEQKQFLENVIQYSAAPTFVLDRSHRVVLWNRACEEMTGIKAADIVGTDGQWRPFYKCKQPVLADLIFDGNTQALPRLYTTYANSKFIPDGLQAEAWFPNMHGVERYISFNAAPIRNCAGELIAAVETFEDLTEFKMTEKKLMESEKRYRVLFEESPAIMLVIDPESAEIIGANGAAISFYGYSRQELIGKPMTEIIAQPSEQVFQMLREVAQGPHYVHLRHRLASGELRDVALSRGPINLDDKTYLFSVIQDVTAHKVAEEALREGEYKLEAITSTTADAIILIDEKGDVCYWNFAAEKMFGYDISEMMGQNLNIIIPQQYREAHRKGFTNFVSTGHGPMVGKIYEVSALRKDGSEFPVELSISGLLLKGNWHSAGVVRDITGRKNMEIQLHQAQKMEALGTFAGGIAHDFNNMLTVIIGHGTILTMKMAKDDPLVHDVQQVLAAADRAANLTQSLLAFSRKTPIKRKPVNLNNIVGRIEKLLARLLRENIEFKTSLADEELIIMADSAQLEQVLMNLATNAQDAIPNGGRVAISTDAANLDLEFIQVHGYGTPGRYAVLSFSDTGFGMNEETAQRIFEPFFTTKEVSKGTGLGLAIVYGIVQQHDGYINCYSEPGIGTTFRIYLPLARTVSEEELEASEPSPTGGTETILVAEDDIAVRSLNRQLLETFGYKVIEAVDGEDAIAKFIENKAEIRLVVLDVVMPQKNGKEACEEIKRILPEMKFLFTSGYASDIFEYREITSINFISKPILPTILLNKIREILDK
jgi:PAS domain S-box-containing protein